MTDQRIILKERVNVSEIQSRIVLPIDMRKELGEPQAYDATLVEEKGKRKVILEPVAP